MVLSGLDLLEGDQGTTEVLGMFTGKTGIAYQFLRFFDWSKTPSVLCLEVSHKLNKVLHE